MSASDKKTPQPPTASSKPEAAKEKFHLVRFHVKRDANDTDDVVLSVQGNPLQIERDKEVIIPERYRVCADNARYPVYRQMPNEPRKIVGEVLVYPYSWVREATEAEYLAMKVKPKAG